AVTGVRVSELKYFTVEQVKKGRIEVHNKGKYRRIFLTSDIRKKLLCFAMFRKITRGYIFATKSGKAKDRSNIWSEMKALKEKAMYAVKKFFRTICDICLQGYIIRQPKIWQGWRTFWDTAA